MDQSTAIIRNVTWIQHLSHVYTIQPVAKPVVKPVWQPVEGTVAVHSTRFNRFDNRSGWQPVGCLFTRYSRLSSQLYNRFDNWLYCVNGVLRLSISRRNNYLGSTKALPNEDMTLPVLSVW